MSGKRGRTDAADATAICDAVQRPDMRFVPVKSEGTSKPGYAYTGTAKALSNSAPPLSAGGHPLDGGLGVTLRYCDSNDRYEQRDTWIEG